MFNLFRKKPLTFDPALGDPLALMILREAREGRTTTLFTKVAGLRQGQWDRRAFYIDLAGKQLVESKKPLDLPDTPLSHLLLGSMAIEAAWKARTGGVAADVTEEGWKGFFACLEQAAQSLTLAAQQDQEDPTPVAFFQTVAMGLQVERSVADDWHAEALRRDPLNQAAHSRRLWLLCKKWGGSHEEMYDYVREVAAKAPLGTTLPAIVYAAYQEHVLWLHAFEPDEEGFRAFLHDPAVRRETAGIYEASLQKRPRIEHVSDYWPHNLAAWWFYMLKVETLVRIETRKIGPNFTMFPWALFYESPATVYQKVSEL